ncbi:MAG: DUF484 family protein [Nitrospinales bacterium]
MNPEQFKEKIAIYLNEHPEFFNDYPELLEKVKSIKSSDLPLPPAHTISVSDRIIQRARSDRKHIKGKLEWFIDLARKNEKIHEHLDEIERLALSCTELLPMMAQLRAEIMKRFDIHHVVICLADSPYHFTENRLKERYPEPMDGELRFVEPAVLDSWLENGFEPVLRGEINGKSRVFPAPGVRGLIHSEAIIPIVIRGKAAGCLGLGAPNPYHFHEELRSDFLAHMAGKLAIAIDNIFLMERLKTQSVMDPLTGHYSRAYFDPVLAREFDRSHRYRKMLSCLIMCIDYFDNLINTYGNEKAERILKETGGVLSECCRSSDIVIRYNEAKFFVLLPETDSDNAVRLAERIRQGVESRKFPVAPESGGITASVGVASYPSPAVASREDLVKSAFTGLAQAVEKGGNRVRGAVCGE